MGNSPGDDQNNDGLNDTTGKNIFGGTNTKMTDEEREALDQEIMDLLDEQEREEQEKSMFSNDAEATAGTYFSDDATGASGGWSPGDKVPSVGVVRNVTDFATGEVSQIYSIDGKNVTKEEFDENSAKRSSFVNQATNPNSPYHEEAFAAESLRTQNKDYRSGEHREEYEKTQNDADAYVKDNRDTNTKLNDLRDNPAFSNLPYNTQQSLMQGVASNNKQMQTQALQDFARELGKSQRQDDPSMRAYVLEVLGADNVANIRGFGQLSGAEYAKAIVDGLNSGSGVDINVPFTDINIAQGLGGTNFRITDSGQITATSQGNQLLGTGVDLATMYATSGMSNAARLATGALDVNFGEQTLSSWASGGEAKLGSNPNITLSPSNLMGSLGAKYIGGPVGGEVAKGIYKETGNIPLAMTGVVASNKVIKDLVTEGSENLGLPGSINIAGKNYDELPTGSGGKGTKATVNTKSGVTSSIQSDLQAVDETGQDSDIDYTDSGFGSNLKSGGSNNNNNNDDGGNDTNYVDPLQNIKKTPLDVNTLQNFGTETTPLTLQNNDASLMMNMMNRGFGGRYLQRGRNRDTGSVTTRRATQREVDRDNRRSGILFG